MRDFRGSRPLSPVLPPHPTVEYNGAVGQQIRNGVVYGLMLMLAVGLGYALTRMVGPLTRSPGKVRPANTTLSRSEQADIAVIVYRLMYHGEPVVFLLQNGHEPGPAIMRRLSDLPVHALDVSNVFATPRPDHLRDLLTGQNGTLLMITNMNLQEDGLVSVGWLKSDGHTTVRDLSILEKHSTGWVVVEERRPIYE